LGVEVVICMRDCICRHTQGLNIASSVCRDLMDKRRKIKHSMKLNNLLLKKGNSTQELKDKIKVEDLLQWAVKIAANSLYGSLAFRDYNTYSPRCGMSVTSVGRWSLHIAIAVVQSLGCMIVYGDTDSVMFTISQYSDKTKLISSYVDSINSNTSLSRYEILELICGSNPAINESLATVNRMHGCITNILNHVMNYTCVSALKVESQETGCSTPSGTDCYVFDKMMILASKHYIAKDMNGNSYSKGVSYVRRTGAKIQDVAAKSFSDIVLSSSSRADVIARLRREYKRLVTGLSSQNRLDQFRVRATRNGITKDHVRIVPERGNSKSARYAEFEKLELEEDFDIDIRYYIESIRTCLNSICRSIGLPDETFITHY
jgi:DNA polymerase elongation subunit (family B)